MGLHFMSSVLKSDTLSVVFLRIAPSRFHYLKFLLEAYDNLCVLSSFDSKMGIVIVRYPDSSAKECFLLLGSIAHQISTTTPLPVSPDKIN